MPMRSIVGDFPWETSMNHCIVVGSPHIGAGQGAPRGVGTQVHSDVPFLRTVTISQSTSVAESAMYSGAARSASAIFSCVVGSLLSVMVTELQHTDAIIHKSLHLPVSSPFCRKLTFQSFTNSLRAASLDRHTPLRLVMPTSVRRALFSSNHACSCSRQGLR